MPRFSEGLANQPNRLRIGRFASRFLAATALLTSMLPLPVEARTIDHPKPLTFTEDDCSQQTLLAGPRPAFQEGTGNVTARGYYIDEPSQSGRVLATIANPNQADRLKVSTYNFDLSLHVNPAEISTDKTIPTAPASIRIMWSFPASTTIDPLMRPTDPLSEFELEEVTLDDATPCTLVEFQINGGQTNINVNGKNKVASNPAF